MKNVGPKELTAATELFSMEVNGYHQLFGFQHSSKIFFCVQQQNNPSISLKHLTHSNYGVHKNAKYINKIKSANCFKNAYINWLTNRKNSDY